MVVKKLFKPLKLLDLVEKTELISWTNMWIGLTGWRDL